MGGEVVGVREKEGFGVGSFVGGEVVGYAVGGDVVGNAVGKGVGR